MTKDKSLHENHRQRLKNRFLESGLDTFEEHQVLELALFYAIPRKDTNPVAHRLIKRFGNLAGVFNAPLSELVKVEGVGEGTAVFLKMQHGLLLRYRDCFHEEKQNFASHRECQKYICERMKYLSHEEFHVMCLDCSMNLLRYMPLFKGTVSSAAVNLRELTAKVLESNCSAVVIAHNHPSGVAYPSQEDINLTETLMTALKYQEVELLDHMIITDKACYSMHREGMVQELKIRINGKIPLLFVAQESGGFKE